MKRMLVLSAVLAAVGITVMATQSSAEDYRYPVAGEEFLGNDNAPVTIVEYASATCGHCGTFHNEHLPEIKEKYVETGKVKFVLRDLPWDNLAYAVSTVARCSGDYYTFMSAFMSTQNAWIASEDKLGAIKQVARLGGMDGPTVDECIKNEEVSAKIREGAKIATDTLGVTGTPSFFINGQKFSGVLTSGEMAKIIDKELAKAEKK